LNFGGFLNMEMEKYAELFIEESKENLQGLNQILLELEKEPEQIKLVNDIFRIAHTLKGMSATMGYNKMAQLTHVMEDTLDQIRNGKRKPDTNLVELLFKCLDALESYVENIAKTRNEGEEEYKDIINQLIKDLNDKAVEDKIKVPPNVSSKSEQSLANMIKGQEGYPDLSLDEYEFNIISKAKEMENIVCRIDISLDGGCLLKSARAFLFFKMLEDYGDVIKSYPVTNDIEEERFDYDITVIFVFKSSKEDIQREIERLSEISNYSISSVEEIKEDHRQKSPNISV
jgi:two-component system, chemotaxis family, sensor kinase CheA